VRDACNLCVSDPAFGLPHARPRRLPAAAVSARSIARRRRCRGARSPAQWQPACSWVVTTSRHGTWSRDAKASRRERAGGAAAMLEGILASVIARVAGKYVDGAPHPHALRAHAVARAHTHTRIRAQPCAGRDSFGHSTPQVSTRRRQKCQCGRGRFDSRSAPAARRVRENAVRAFSFTDRAQTLRRICR